MWGQSFRASTPPVTSFHSSEHRSPRGYATLTRSMAYSRHSSSSSDAGDSSVPHWMRPRPPPTPSGVAPLPMRTGTPRLAPMVMAPEHAAARVLAACSRPDVLAVRQTVLPPINTPRGKETRIFAVILKRSFYQDKLGTNIGNTQNRTRVF